jgi:hypothetical protein
MTFSGNNTSNREIDSRGYQGQCGVDEERLGRAIAVTIGNRRKRRSALSRDITEGNRDHPELGQLSAYRVG